MITLRRVVGASSLQLCGQGASLLLQAAYLGVLARLLSPELFGDVIAAMALLTVAGAVGEFGLLNTAVIDMGRRSGASNVVAWETLGAALAMGGAAVVLCLPIAVFALGGYAAFAVVALTPAFFAKRLETPLLGLRQFEFRFGQVAGADLAVSAASLAFVLPVTMHSFGAPATLVVIGAGAVAANVIGVACLAFPSLPKPVRPTAAGVLSLIRRAVPLGLTNSVSLVHNRADQLLLAFLGFRVGLAEYAIAYKVVDAALALVTAVNGVSFPILVRRRERVRRDARRVALAYAVLGIVLAGGAALLAPALVTLLGGGRYGNSARLLELLSPAILVFVVNSGFAQVAIAQARTRALLVIVVVATVANIGANGLLISLVGVPGAAISTLLTGMLSAIAVAWIALRSGPEPGRNEAGWRQVAAAASVGGR